MAEADREEIETLSGDPGLALPEFDDPPEDPLPLLDQWLQLADERGVREPRALALATADATGRPSSRILLPLDDPAALRRAADALRSSGEPLRRPPRWGGFRLDPDLIEFWHGSPDRLHRRLLYVKQEGRWTHQRLQP